MTANPYPNLGWNPAPGVSGEVATLLRKVKSAAAALDSSHQQIERLLGESAHWEGDAADAFRDALDGDLPKYMMNAAFTRQGSGVARCLEWRPFLPPRPRAEVRRGSRGEEVRRREGEAAPCRSGPGPGPPTGREGVPQSAGG